MKDVKYVILYDVSIGASPTLWGVPPPVWIQTEEPEVFQFPDVAINRSFFIPVADISSVVVIQGFSLMRLSICC